MEIKVKCPDCGKMLRVTIESEEAQKVQITTKQTRETTKGDFQMTDIRDEIINRWKELGEKAALLPCPRCGHLKMDKDLHHNALSRRVDLYVCSSCGTEEAMEDYNGRKKPFEEWFVFTELFGGQAPVRETADEEFKLNVQRQIVVTKEDVDDIVCCALEGGITYWCNKAEVVEDDYYGEYASEQISRGGSLRLYDREEDETYLLTLEKLLNGIRLACRDGYGEEWIDGENLDCCQIDCEAADTIVQYALFGELVFG